MLNGEKQANSRLQGLDLIRGMAIALVMVRHAWPEQIGTAGVVGVVVFFSLSGYLITGLLVRDIREHGGVRYGRFYRNRALRLIPPLLFLMAGLVAVTVTVNPLGDSAADLARASIISVLYLGNLPIDLGSAAIGHLWTLATEEQFYLVWPVVLAVGIRFRRLGLVVTISGLGLLCAAALSIVVAQPDAGRVYALPTSWAVAMVIGAASRIWQDWVSRLLPQSGPRRAWCTAVAVIALVLIGLLPEDKSAPTLYLVVGPAAAVLTVVVAFHLRTWRTLPNPILKPLWSLGLVSYAAYLWNYPIAIWIGERPLTWWQAVGSIGLTIVMATVSWWLIERPVLALKTRLNLARKMPSEQVAAVP